ncbi:hypothetical protein [Chitinophaga parva]|nr:hypothetical protein [Chitinophaga parva]
MKKVIIAALFAMAITTSASAAPAGPGHGWGGRPVVIVHSGFYSPWYGPYGGWGFGYPYGYPYAMMPYRPSKLDLQIQDIRNDYADKIESMKMDRSLSGKERRQKIREFKAERDHEIRDTKANYYKS